MYLNISIIKPYIFSGNIIPQNLVYCMSLIVDEVRTLIMRKNTMVLNLLDDVLKEYYSGYEGNIVSITDMRIKNCRIVYSFDINPKYEYIVINSQICECYIRQCLSYHDKYIELNIRLAKCITEKIERFYPDLSIEIGDVEDIYESVINHYMPKGYKIRIETDPFNGNTRILAFSDLLPESIY